MTQVDETGWAVQVVRRTVGAGAPDERDRQKVRLVVADALWQAVAAHDLPVARSALAWARSAAPGRCTIVGSDRGVSAEAAALANAALVHARLTDDAHPGALAHPAAVVVPTALALGQERSASGAEVVRAVAAGYRAFALMAQPAAEAVAARGMRNTAVFGPSAAAVAAACLLGLDGRRGLAALMIAAGSSGGTLQAFRAGSPEWRLQPGLAAQIGIVAARWAAVADEDDLAYPPGALEGPGGLYETFGVHGGGDEFLGGASEDHDGLAGTTFKLHATCGANQVPVEVLAELHADHGFAADDVERIEVSLVRAAYEYPGCNDRGPFTAAGGYLSRPLALAAVVLTGAHPLTAAEIASALADDRLDALTARIHSVPYSDDAGRHPQEATVRVVLRDGRTIVGAGARAIDRLRLPDPHARSRSFAALIGSVAVEIGDRARELPEVDADALMLPLRNLETAQS